jgi:hypothetical protein
LWNEFFFSAPQLKRDSLGGALAITRYSPGRAVAVTIGLSVAGAAFGAVAGATALAIALLWSEGLGLFSASRILLLPALIGAVLGAVCAPLAGWLLLRHVPLGRAFGGLTLGATIGGLVGWFLPWSFDPIKQSITVAALGFLCAAVLLRIRHARPQSKVVTLDDSAA